MTRYRVGKTLPGADRFQHRLLHCRQLRQRGSDGLHHRRQRGESGVPLQSHADLGGILVSHETYSLVKDIVLAEERDPIQAKGFAKPVRNYRVLDQLDKLVGERKVIREEQDGLRIFLDLQKLDKTRAAQALKSILSRTRELSGNQDPSSSIQRMIIVDVANAALPTPGASQVNETGASSLSDRFPHAPMSPSGQKRKCSERANEVRFPPHSDQTAAAVLRRLGARMRHSPLASMASRYHKPGPAAAIIRSAQFT